MCVIFSCEDSLPTLNQLELGEKSNPHGGGYATLIKGKLIYRKGLTAKEIWDDIQKGKIQIPCIIHFRIKSVGIITPKLSHPFEISDDVELNLEGKFNAKSKVSGLFFHNGTIQEWKTHYFNTVRVSQSRMLKGDMSDSRAMAFIVNKYGHEVLEYIDPKDTYNKYAVLDHEGIHRYGNWKKCGSIMASNDYFEEKPAYSYQNEFGYGGMRSYEGNGFIKDEFDISNESDYMDYNPLVAKKNDEEFGSKEFKSLELKRDSLIKKIAETESKTKAIKKQKEKRYRKRDRKADIRFLREHGWSNPQRLNNYSLQMEVENLQRNKVLIDKAKEKAKDGKSLTYKEYEEILEENKQNYEHYTS